MAAGLRGWLRALLAPAPRHQLDLPAWAAALEHPPLLGLSDAERAMLEHTCERVLARTVFAGTHGLVVDDAMATAIATQLALPLMALPEAAGRSCRTVLVYPTAFVSRGAHADEAGVVHEAHEVRSGEAWAAGPLLLAWEDARPGAAPWGPASNLVIHELVHKLDFEHGGVANGFPVLPAGADPAAWSHDLQAAHAALEAAVAAGEPTVLDPYALDGPDEFLAVAAEAFFMAPGALHSWQPALYRQLALAFAQDPLQRHERIWAPRRSRHHAGRRPVQRDGCAGPVP